MIEVVPAKSREITEIRRRQNRLYLKQESGVIRLCVQDADIIRVSYTESGSFADEEMDSAGHVKYFQGKEYAQLFDDCAFCVEEDSHEIRLHTDILVIKVNRRTGALRYEKKDGSILVQEREQDSKQVEAFDVWKIAPGAQVEEIKTPDGIKRKIKDGQKILAGQKYHTWLHLTFSPDELLWGLGQAEEGVWNLRHTTQYLHQANRKIALPMLISSAGYGLLLSTQSPAVFEDTAGESYLYTEADDFLDYYFIAGDPERIVGSFRRLTGKAIMLPKWAFGYMQSRERYETAQELVETAQRFRQEGFGMDTLVQDWMSWPEGMWGQKSFDEERFADPDQMMHALHELDTHLLISIWPNMAPESENYREFYEAGLLFPNSNLYDAFSEDGRRLYWQQVKRGLFQYGVDGWWCDSSEPVTPEWERICRPPSAEMYRNYVEEAAKIMPVEQANAYGLYHAMGIYEGQREETAAKRVINLTRSGYPGSQKYGTILWSGDIEASWKTLKRQVTAGLQFSLSGLPYWTLDIGAFFVKKGYQWYWNGEFPGGLEDKEYWELYVRWFQYGAFLPVFRSHGTDVYREPWYFGEAGEPFYDALCAANGLRYRLMPYIYSLAGAVWRHDSLMMRPLLYDFPEDKRAAGISQQYMFGTSLMICPVTEPGIQTMTIYLPEGTRWYDYYTLESWQGGQEIERKICLERIPIFVRAGAIIPMTEATDHTVCREEHILLQVYAGEDGSFVMYEDAGDGYGYEKGEYCETDILYDDKNRLVTWNTRGQTDYRTGELEYQIVGDQR